MPKKLTQEPKTAAKTAAAASGSKSICKHKSAIIAGLEKYKKKHQLEKDHMRVKAYGAAIGALGSHSTEINSAADVKNIPGIGKKIYEKVEEYFREGAFREAKSKFSDSKVKGLEELNEIWGVGPEKAEKLYDSGFTSVAKLRASKSGDEALTTM